MPTARKNASINKYVQNALTTLLHRSKLHDELLCDLHCNRCYELLFVLKGSAKFEIEGEIVLLKENTGIVIEPLQYQLVFGNSDVYERIISFFYIDQIPEPIREAFTNRIQKYYVFSSMELTQLFQKFAKAYEGGEDTFLELQKALFTVITYSIALDDTIAKSAQVGMKTERLRQIIAYLDKNISKDVRVEDIANQMHISQSTVYRLFKDEMKISLKQYILQKKMIYADSLLHQGVSPGDVALTCGYKNYASFYRIFLKVIGRSPGKVLPKSELLQEDVHL